MQIITINPDNYLESWTDELQKNVGQRPGRIAFLFGLLHGCHEEIRTLNRPDLWSGGFWDPVPLPGSPEPHLFPNPVDPYMKAYNKLDNINRSDANYIVTEAPLFAPWFSYVTKAVVKGAGKALPIYSIGKYAMRLFTRLLF